MNSARGGSENIDDVAELRRRLDMAEDELTFLKAVFEEYKDSSGELEAELDAQLKDLERSNLALKRENEQIRAQLQSTVTRSRKSAEEASNLTTALETHLEELTKREKKAQSRVRLLEQEVDQLKAEIERIRAEPPVVVQAPPPPPVVVQVPVATESPASSEELRVTKEELENTKAQVENFKAQFEKTRAQLDKTKVQLDQANAHKLEEGKRIEVLKHQIYDARVSMTKLTSMAELRFAAAPSQAHPVPALDDENANDLETMAEDLKKLVSDLTTTSNILTDTVLAKALVAKVSAMLFDHNLALAVTLEGKTEQSINNSCFAVLGKIMVLGESLPEFRRPVNNLKTSLKEASTDNAAACSQLAHTILTVVQDIMKSVFDPYENRTTREDELKKMKEDTVAKIEAARRDEEKKAEERINKERADAEARLAQLQQAQTSTASSLDEVKKEMERLKAENESQLQSARTEAKQLAEKARREALEEAAIQRKALEEEIYQSVAAEMDALREALEKSEAQYTQAAMRQKMYQDSMKNAIIDQSKAMTTAMARARQEIETLRRSSQSELADTQKLMNESLNHVRKVARTIAKTDIAQLSMMYERELDLRVKLQDQVQSLKGNIRVFCRIRPLLGAEIEDGETVAVFQSDEMTVTTEDPDDPNKRTPFMFDRVFGPEDSQEVVFDEMRTLCLSALDGYNVCLFAYGITGSGKTFTVEGGAASRDNPKQHGLVYRTMKEIFRIAFGERAGAYDTVIEFQLIELYNDDFRDLLVMPGDKAPKLEVRIIPDLGVIVENVKKIKIDKLEDAMELLKRGYSNRSTKFTNSNSVSSRSHSILTLHLSGINVKTKKAYNGKLHFVDLAGSERVGKSGVTGDALKEAQAINLSLSALGDVIQALSTKEKFIPYRNSSLTKLLQESLGGNSKTVMICNIAPCKHSVTETVNSLRFATRAHKVEMGKATQNEAANNPPEVKNLKNKLADLESQFKSRSADPKARGGAAAKPGAAAAAATAAAATAAAAAAGAEVDADGKMMPPAASPRNRSKSPSAGRVSTTKK
eukprot:c3027_g1_i1.p1 GENE.c3027_g1_i1~~c3027_g1_i1.p1  ORF type:complete len:1046 (+),score=249.52 c3027_g1_i1:174-3311(+)